MSTATEARDEAIERVDKNAPREWMEVAEKCVMDLALSRDTFTTDDVILELVAKKHGLPSEPRALGPVMKRARREQWIEPTATFRQSERASRHAAPIRVWRSLISREAQW